MTCPCCRMAYREGKKERPPFLPQPKTMEPEKPQIPLELKCRLCLDLMTDAVVVPCCGTSFCDECKYACLKKCMEVVLAWENMENETWQGLPYTVPHSITFNESEDHKTSNAMLSYSLLLRIPQTNCCIDQASKSS